MKRTPILIATAALALAGFACSGDSGDSAAPAGQAGGKADEVVIKTFIFRPNPIEVGAGTTVTFTNQDDILHTVTSGVRGQPTPMFDGQLQGIGSTFRHTFTAPGTYEYFCKIHPGMDARVVVR